ncbi:hypothetical protein BKA56DRAFT_705815 [Ilyonectria sp. MPI-CAGE-AT-0026]|nr:hypothetical protein BKA56DRAFT_705815 [Ilyonectria sp. MPI-CAGE-AT-0026]
MARQRSRTSHRRERYGRKYGSYQTQHRGNNSRQHFAYGFAQGSVQQNGQHQANNITEMASGANAVPLGSRDRGFSQHRAAANQVSRGVQTVESGMHERGNAPVFISNAAAKAIIASGGSVPTLDVITETPWGSYCIRTKSEDTLLQAFDMMSAMIDSSHMQAEMFPILHGDDAMLRAGKAFADLNIKARRGYSSLRLRNSRH